MEDLDLLELNNIQHITVITYNSSFYRSCYCIVNAKQVYESFNLILQKSSYLYTKRLLPGSITHSRKSDTFQQKPIIQQSFKAPHCFNIQMVHSNHKKAHIHFYSLISHKPQKIKISLKADKLFQYSPRVLFYTTQRKYIQPIKSGVRHLAPSYINPKYLNISENSHFLYVALLLNLAGYSCTQFPFSLNGQYIPKYLLPQMQLSLFSKLI